MSDTNAKEELLGHLRDNKVSIKCAKVWCVEYYRKNPKTFFLRCGHYPEELKQFIDSLDFEYDSGYGGQELFGTLWHTDGTWSERGEYDGSEWWEHRSLPAVPEELK